MLVEHATQWAWQAMGGTRIEVLYTFLVFLGVLLVVRCMQWLRYVRSLPPGPWGVPVFGYLPFLKGDVHLRYGELAKKYGPMFSARLGTQLVVVLSDHRTIRDTFRREEFTGRPHTEFINILGGYGKCITRDACHARFPITNSISILCSRIFFTLRFPTRFLSLPFFFLLTFLSTISPLYACVRFYRRIFLFFSCFPLLTNWLLPLFFFVIRYIAFILLVDYFFRVTDSFDSVITGRKACIVYR